MTGPLDPSNDPGSPTPLPDPPGPAVAPSVFISDYTFPTPGTVVVPPLPRSVGGLIQSVKTGLVQGVRDALSNTSLFNKDEAIYVSLEYPMLEANYPGVWVQFAVTKMNRAGVGHEVVVQNPTTHEWSFVQEWTFEGRATLSIAALSSVDRDRLADAIIVNLAFARTPEIILTQPQVDTKKFRSLITALDENPYVALTLQLDTIIPGGQTVSQGTPWGEEDILVYEDNYSFDMVGQFNVQFDRDGVYTLAEIVPNIDQPFTNTPYNPSQWIPGGPVQPGAPGQNFAGGQTNVGNLPNNPGIF